MALKACANENLKNEQFRVTHNFLRGFSLSSVISERKIYRCDRKFSQSISNTILLVSFLVFICGALAASPVYFHSFFRNSLALCGLILGLHFGNRILTRRYSVFIAAPFIRLGYFYLSALFCGFLSQALDDSLIFVSICNLFAMCIPAAIGISYCVVFFVGPYSLKISSLGFCPICPLSLIYELFNNITSASFDVSKLTWSPNGIVVTLRVDAPSCYLMKKESILYLNEQETSELEFRFEPVGD